MNATAWEHQIEAWNAQYLERGTALVAKVPAAVRVVNQRSGSSTFTAAWARKGSVDFVGQALGRPVWFEAKATSGKRWALWGRAGLKPHQGRQLRQADAQGGEAFVLLHFGGCGWFVPWSSIIASPKQSWALADLETHAQRIPETAGWLACLS